MCGIRTKYIAKCAAFAHYDHINAGMALFHEVVSMLEALAKEMGMGAKDLQATAIRVLEIMAADGVTQEMLASPAGAQLAVTYMREDVKRQEAIFMAYQTSPRFRAECQEAILDMLSA